MPAGESRFPRFWLWAGAAALLLVAVISFCVDAANVEQGGAIDLRNRITGARLMAAGIDPYFYKWTRADSELYCDPYNNPHLKVSKTTSTPTMLALSLPWAEFPYRSGQWLWFSAQWALLLGMAALWWFAARGAFPRLLVGAILAVFTFGAAWRLHAERGQCYIAFTFLFAFWLAGTLRVGRGWAFASGFAAGLLAAVRPPALLLLPILGWKRRDQIPGMAVGLALGVVIPLFFLGGIWTDYTHGMQQQGLDYVNDFAPRPGPQSYPATIEGMDTNLLASFVPIAYADASVHVVLRALGAEPANGAAVFVVGAIAIALWGAWARQRDLPRLLLGVAAWMYLLDFFLPAYRNSYNDVLALNFLALGVLIAPRFWIAYIPTALALAAGIWVYATSPEVKWQIDLPAMLLAVTAILYLFAPRGNGVALDTAAAPRQKIPC